MNDSVNILLVDDRPENLAALEAVLSSLGESLVHAQSGEEALRQVLNREFAVILMDASMPGLDGYETARLLQYRRRSALTPIIFITANDPDGRLAASGYAVGAVDYIIKPFDPDILRSKVRVFTNLMRKTHEVERQAVELEERIQRQHELLEKNRALETQLEERAVEAERRAELARIMAIELTQAEQRERRRISQILHDNLQQDLIATLYRLRGIYNDHMNDGGLRHHIAEISNLLRRALKSSRTLTLELSPPMLNEGGLAISFEWLARQIQEKHGLTVELDLQLCDDSPEDELKIFLFYAVRELLFNVRKHAAVDRAHLSAHAAEDGLWVSVRDEGRGFVKEIAGNGGRIADSFGLMSIQDRIEVFGGTFRIESSPGAGTLVTLWIPGHVAFRSKHASDNNGGGMNGDGEAEPRLAPAVSARNGCHRLLLVDDHDILREGLRTLLGNLPDMEVVGVARSGEEAIEKAQACQPNVVVMDISLPGINGVEATRRILRECPGVRVIGLSMHDPGDVGSIVLKAGAEVFLSKDEPPERLIAAIRRELI